MQKLCDVHRIYSSMPPLPPKLILWCVALPPVLSDEVPLVISRQLLTTFAQEMGKLPVDVHKAAAMQ